jgi:hypothetical protein
VLRRSEEEEEEEEETTEEERGRDALGTQGQDALATKDAIATKGLATKEKIHAVQSAAADTVQQHHVLDLVA